MKTKITIAKAKTTNAHEYDFNNIVFGSDHTDHMFISEYRNRTWCDHRIEPFRELNFSPLALGLHYGQSVFEGFKAYKRRDGNIGIFRSDMHYERFNRSLQRMCMPVVPKELFTSALEELIQLEKDWVPSFSGTSLYIRPLIIATEGRLGVKVSDEYIFIIACLPMASYYCHNLKVKVETEFVRAADGGTGAAKCAGNYGGTFYPLQLAKEKGFDQVLWTDSLSHEYLEESGTMNLMFVINNTIVTPPLSGNILEGVTRDSVISIAKEMGVKVEERKISYKELETAFQSNLKVEAFGVGTAAVISPIECIEVNGNLYYPDVSESALYRKLERKLTAIRIGTIEDKNNWNQIIDLTSMVNVK